MKSKGMKLIVLSLLLCFLLSVVILSHGAFAQANSKIINNAKVTITMPVGGKTPDYHPKSAEPGKYTIFWTYWYVNESPWTQVTSTDTFQPGKEYALRISLRPVNGHTFSEECVYTINGEETVFYQGYHPYSAGIQLITAAPPQAVTSLQATSKDKDITVQWKPSQGATGYLIYRQAPGESKMTYRSLQSSTLFSETVHKEGTYYYRVYPYIKLNDKMVLGESNTYVKTYVSFRPDPVQNLKAEGKSSYILLSWSPVSNIDGYVIYRQAPEEDRLSYHRILSSSPSSYKDTPLSAPGYYFYRVYAYRTLEGKRIFSLSKSYVYANATFEPDPVGNLTSRVVGNKAVVLNWSPSGNAQGYIIYRRGPGESKFSYRWIVAKGTTSFTDSQVSKGTYFYRVYPYVSYKGKKIPGKSLNYTYSILQ